MAHVLDQWGATEAMKTAFDDGRLCARTTAEMLITQARIAWLESDFSLPAQNENGEPILHMARKQLTHVRDYLMQGFDGLRYACGRDYHDMLKYRYMYAAMGDGPRFYSEEEWDKKAHHLIVTQAYLQEKVSAGADEI